MKSIFAGFYLAFCVLMICYRVFFFKYFVLLTLLFSLNCHCKKKSYSTCLRLYGKSFKQDRKKVLFDADERLFIEFVLGSMISNASSSAKNFTSLRFTFSFVCRASVSCSLNYVFNCILLQFDNKLHLLISCCFLCGSKLGKIL